MYGAATVKWKILLVQSVPAVVALTLVVLSAGFAVYANIIADATAMEPDEMFETI